MKTKKKNKSSVVVTTKNVDRLIKSVKKGIKEQNGYFALIKVFGKTFTAKGSTVKEAIENLNVGKLNKGVSVLQITHNGSSSSKILPSVQTARLFSPSPLTREVAIKNVSLRFFGI